jgi:2-dehydropantoate 2-reductase
VVQEIKKIAILGAGALGATYAAQFYDTDPDSVILIADGERYQRLRQAGFNLNGRQYTLPVLRPGEAEAPVDLIIVGLKHHHLDQALPDLRGFVGEHTTILSVMNGLDSEDMIGAVYGMDKLLYAIAVGIDAVREGNAVVVNNPGRIIFGEAENTSISPRVSQVRQALDRAGILHETPVDMLRILWWKFMVNVGVNQASAVMRAPYGAFQFSVDAQALMESLMREVLALAGQAGINLVEQDIADWYAVLNTLSPVGKTSMLQDIEARRKTEVEIFAGKVVALGQRYGVPVPVNETVMRIIRVLERAEG